MSGGYLQHAGGYFGIMNSQNTTHPIVSPRWNKKKKNNISVPKKKKKCSLFLTVVEKWGNIHFMAAYFLCQCWATRDWRLEDFIKILRVHSCRVAAHTHTHAKVGNKIHNFSLALPNLAAVLIKVWTAD